MSNSVVPTVHETNSSNNSTFGGSSNSSTVEMSIDLEQSAFTSFLEQNWAPISEESHGDSILNFLNFDELDDDLSALQFIPDFSVGFSDDSVTDLPTISSTSSAQFHPTSSPPRPVSLSVLEAYLSSRPAGPESDQGPGARNSSNDHECLPKLHEILESLLVPHQHTLPSTVLSEGLAQVVPLDLILQLNRQATENLLSLATCPCAKLPHVTLLYASIISQILAWYRQAAGGSHNMPSQRTGASTTCAETDPTFHIPGAVSPQSTEIKVSQSRVAIGTFDVDDQHLQKAMKIHLLSGEMKRVQGLMNQLRSHTNGTNTVASGVNNVFQSVNSWLEWEFSNIFDMMQSQLKQLNI